MTELNRNEIVFETERLFFRRLTEDDVDNLQKIFSDPVAMQYYPKTFTVEETKVWIQQVLTSYEHHDAGLWACHLKSTREFVGHCGLTFRPAFDGRDEVDVSYLFVRKFWHKGLATEAVKGVMQFAREKLGCSRLISIIGPANMPSRRVASRNGFAPEKEIMYKGNRAIVYVNDPSVTNALQLAQEVADRLGKIDGILAVVLGGSFSRGEANVGSDIDMGLYYDPEHRPTVKQLNELAAELDDGHAINLITEYGEWGPWINGGGWLKIKKRAVDWLYRDIALVSKVIKECQSGQSHCYYYPGHPHGFHDHYYLAEIHYCQLLYDPKGIVKSLKEQIKKYPPLLKKALIEKYLWEADFSLKTGFKAVKREDVFYVSGCLFRCAACLMQVIFALNERYFMNEKGSIQTADSFLIRPRHFTDTVTKVLASPGMNENELRESVSKLETLAEEIKKLAEAN